MKGSGFVRSRGVPLERVLRAGLLIGQLEHKVLFWRMQEGCVHVFYVSVHDVAHKQADFHSLLCCDSV